MTYQDAIDFKEKLDIDQVIKNDLTMKECITPADHSDFTRYIADYRLGHFTDETAIKYSLNGQFKVCGLWTDGENVIHKNLS